MSLVQPGLIDTNMPRTVQRSLQQWQAAFPTATPEQLALYDRTMQVSLSLSLSTGILLACLLRSRQMYGSQFSVSVDSLAGQTWQTSAAILHALAAARPQPRYLVGVDAVLLSTLRSVYHFVPVIPLPLPPITLSSPEVLAMLMPC